MRRDGKERRGERGIGMVGGSGRKKKGDRNRMRGRRGETKERRGEKGERRVVTSKCIKLQPFYIPGKRISFWEKSKSLVSCCFRWQTLTVVLEVRVRSPVSV